VNPIPRLHIITNDDILEDRGRIDLIPEMLEPGVAIHLRTRRLTGNRLYEIAHWLRESRPDGWIVINDRADIAVAAEVTGVHLPEAGLPTAEVRRLWGGKHQLTIGRSVHSAAAVCVAIAEGADYALLGPIWNTPSHPQRTGLGLEALDPRNGGPIIAIGGITVDRVLACIEAGAYGVAAIAAIWNAPRPASAVSHMRLLLTGGGGAGGGG
jgi:thiamine-phosphate pyrophosphorylase